jgi:hypothetical protein
MFRLVNPPFGQGIEKCITLPFERNKKRSFMAFMAFMALGLLPSGKTTLDLTGSPRNSVRLLLFSKHFYRKHFYRLATMWTVTPPRQKSTNQSKNDLTYKNTCSDEVPSPTLCFNSWLYPIRCLLQPKVLQDLRSRRLGMDLLVVEWWYLNGF